MIKIFDSSAIDMSMCRLSNKRYFYVKWFLKHSIPAKFPGVSDPDTMMNLTRRREILFGVKTLHFMNLIFV